ncbi:MAG: helix-turn-helix transcriptional regulator [Oscillospiraceae bacterium]
MKSNTMKDLFSTFVDNINKSDVYALTAMANMSAALIKKRVSLGMTQKEFANYLNVTQGMLSRWENTEYNFTIKTMSELCEKIGYSLTINIESTCKPL